MADFIFLNSNSMKDDQAASIMECTRQTSPSSHSMPTRLACDACRDRKIRCDKQRPICGRCAKVNIHCRYSSRAKPTPSKTDLSRFLMTLNNRLNQAEAQLAVDPSLQNHESLPNLWDKTSIGELSRGTISPSQDQTYLKNVGIPNLDSNQCILSESVNDWNTTLNNRSDLSDFDFPSFAANLPTDRAIIPNLLDATENIHFDAMVPDFPPTPASNTITSTLDPIQTLFFNVFHPSFPFVDRNRVQREMADVSPSIEIRTLSYAIMALGALSSPETTEQAARIYQEARTMLDICERQESGESLTSINILQACALLTLYELKRPNQARAWMTLRRAIGLSKIMSLEQPEGPSNQPVEDWNLPTKLRPFASDSCEAEERRRSFWILYILDAISSLRINTRPTLEKQVSLSLPSPTNHTSPKVASIPTLEQVFNNEVLLDTPTSPFIGDIITIFLYRQYLDHKLSSAEGERYAFWDAHYQLNKAINYCRTSLLALHLSGDSSLEPLSLVFRMKIDAVEISLHELALRKAQKDDLPPALIADSTSKCIAAAQDVADALLVTWRLWGRRLDAFRQLYLFIVWPINTAIKSCVHLMKHSQTEIHAGYYARVLRVLISAVGDILEPGTISPILLEDAHRAFENTNGC